jgi:hypothetical protein
VDFLGSGRLRNDQGNDKHGQAGRSPQNVPRTGRRQTEARIGFDRRSPHGSVVLSSSEKLGSRRFAPRFTVNDIGHRNEVTRIHFLKFPNHIDILGRRVQEKISVPANQQSPAAKPIKRPRRFRVAGVNPRRYLTQAPVLFRAGPNEKQGFNLCHGSDVFYDELPNFIGNVWFWHAWTARRDRGGFKEARGISSHERPRLPLRRN